MCCSVAKLNTDHNLANVIWNSSEFNHYVSNYALRHEG